jgi:hypothetical protein
LITYTGTYRKTYENPGKEAEYYLNDPDVRRPLAVSISQRSVEQRLYKLVRI